MSTLLMTLALLVSGADVDDWQWQPGVGFVNTETMEKKTPLEFYTYGVRLASVRKTEEALGVLQLLLRNVRDRKLQEKVRFIRGKILWSGSRFHAAYLALDEFLRGYPESGNAEEAKLLLMDSAFLLAKKGYAGGFWGSIPLIKWIVTSSDQGLNLLRMSLQRYPREPFSSRYYYKLAEFLFEEDELESSIQELKFILTEYSATTEAPKAILLLGKVGLKKYDSIDYDTHGLKEARRNFARFIEETTILSKISPEAAEFVKKELPYARGKIAFINDQEAEKEYRVGEYYRKKGYPRSAKIYYESVQKRYPKTSWAVEAENRLKDMDP